MGKTTDVVGIGGGIMGASVAHFLARKGSGKDYPARKAEPGRSQHRTLRCQCPLFLFQSGDHPTCTPGDGHVRE